MLITLQLLIVLAPGARRTEGQTVPSMTNGYFGNTKSTFWTFGP